MSTEAQAISSDSGNQWRETRQKLRATVLRTAAELLAHEEEAALQVEGAGVKVTIEFLGAPS